MNTWLSGISPGGFFSAAIGASAAMAGPGVPAKNPMQTAAIATRSDRDLGPMIILTSKDRSDRRSLRPAADTRLSGALQFCKRWHRRLAIRRWGSAARRQGRDDCR